MSTQHLATAQQLNADALVTMFRIDGRPLGGSLLCFTPAPIGSSKVVYQGYTYEPVPIVATGFEWSGKGPLPRPTLRVSNIAGYMVGDVTSYDDLVGAEVIRLRTFAKFLDGQPSADPFAHWPEEIYRIERKAKLDKTELAVELSVAFDQQGAMLPGRQMFSAVCMHRYRAWTGSGFSYANATCPYAGGNYAKLDGSVTSNPAEDQCGKRIPDCVKRFGQGQTLPMDAFPGMTLAR